MTRSSCSARRLGRLRRRPGSSASAAYRARLAAIRVSCQVVVGAVGRRAPRRRGPAGATPSRDAAAAARSEHGVRRPRRRAGGSAHAAHEVVQQREVARRSRSGLEHPACAAADRRRSSAAGTHDASCGAPLHVDVERPAVRGRARRGRAAAGPRAPRGRGPRRASARSTRSSSRSRVGPGRVDQRAEHLQPAAQPARGHPHLVHRVGQVAAHPQVLRQERRGVAGPGGRWTASPAGSFGPHRPAASTSRGRRRGAAGRARAPTLEAARPATAPAAHQRGDDGVELLVRRRRRVSTSSSRKRAATCAPSRTDTESSVSSATDAGRRRRHQVRPPLGAQRRDRLDAAPRVSAEDEVGQRPAASGVVERQRPRRAAGACSSVARLAVAAGQLEVPAVVDAALAPAQRHLRARQPQVAGVVVGRRCGRARRARAVGSAAAAPDSP